MCAQLKALDEALVPPVDAQDVPQLGTIASGLSDIATRIEGANLFATNASRSQLRAVSSATQVVRLEVGDDAKKAAALKKLEEVAAKLRPNCDTDE